MRHLLAAFCLTAQLAAAQSSRRRRRSSNTNSDRDSTCYQPLCGQFYTNDMEIAKGASVSMGENWSEATSCIYGHDYLDRTNPDATCPDDCAGTAVDCQCVSEADAIAGQAADAETMLMVWGALTALMVPFVGILAWKLFQFKKELPSDPDWAIVGLELAKLVFFFVICLALFGTFAGMLFSTLQTWSNGDGSYWSGCARLN